MRRQQLQFSIGRRDSGSRTSEQPAPVLCGAENPRYSGPARVGRPPRCSQLSASSSRRTPYCQTVSGHRLRSGRLRAHPSPRFPRVRAHVGTLAALSRRRHTPPCCLAAGTRFHRKSDSSLGASESNLARGLARDRGRASGQGRNERTVALRGCPCTRGGRHAHAPIAAGPFTQPAQASHATEAGGGRMSSLCPVCRARTNSQEKNYRKYIEAGGGRVSSQRRARTKNSQRENITILNFEFGIAGSGQK